MPEVTYCTKCGTPNEADYRFCKNCGTPLVSSNAAAGPAPINNTADPSAGANPEFAIDGITAEEFGLFIGKKAHEIFPKFVSMHLTGSKVSWCWPAAILGFLFGPMGAAFWFLYRKVYKPGAISLLITVLLTILRAISTGLISVNVSDAVVNFLAGDSSALQPLLEASLFGLVFSVMVSVISFIASLLAVVIPGMYSYHLYKEHCIKEITNYKQKQSSNPYYKLGISSLGGTSGGLVFLGIIIVSLTAALAVAIVEIVTLLPI